MIHEIEPENFKSEFELACCFIEHNGKFLLLLRQPWESDGNKWCLPGGMMNAGETPIQAVVREVKEETSIDLPGAELKFVRKVFVRKPERQFVMHTFYINFPIQPAARANPDEHSDHKWVIMDEASRLELLTDGLQTIELFLKWKK